MDLRGHTIVYGASTLATICSLGGVVYYQSYYGGKNPKNDEKKAKDGYIELGLLDQDRSSVTSDCDSHGNGRECKEIMEWSYKNGKCNVYYLDKVDNQYHHWYLGKIQEGLLNVITSEEGKYRNLCGGKKSINFHYEESEKKWKYDGYDRHSWDFGD